MIVNYIGFKDSLQNLNKRFSSTLFKLQFIILLPCSGLLKVEILSSCYSCTVPVLGSHTKVSVLYWSCPGVRLWLPVLYWSCPGVTSWVLVLCWSCPGVRQSLLVLSWSGPGDSCKQYGEDCLHPGKMDTVRLELLIENQSCLSILVELYNQWLIQPWPKQARLYVKL